MKSSKPGVLSCYRFTTQLNMAHGLFQIMSGIRDKYLQAFKITCNNLHEAGHMERA